MSLVNRLKGFDLFAEFTDAEVRQIATFVDEVTYRDEQPILDDASGSNSLYFVLSGKVQILRSITSKCRFTTTLGANEVFGEVAFADQGPRSAKVIADGDVEIGVFAYEHFDIIKKQSPALGMKFLLQMMRALAKKFRVVNKSLDSVLKSAIGESK